MDKMEEKKPHLTSDDLNTLWVALTEHGDDPDVLLLSAERVQQIRQIVYRRAHWQWRLWYRVRYLRANVADWLRARFGQGETGERE